ncbi:spidroin-2-like [Nycticebus coucang]|uniref:spidroin-2-like n=1 Tax=Nycticebus coucang TaxID=9470 RepID=UPI00234CDEDF|nr:spidroin-2-like [Nycticebus coucang]
MHPAGRRSSGTRPGGRRAGGLGPGPGKGAAPSDPRRRRAAAAAAAQGRGAEAAGGRGARRELRRILEKLGAARLPGAGGRRGCGRPGQRGQPRTQQSGRDTRGGRRQASARGGAGDGRSGLGVQPVSGQGQYRERVMGTRRRSARAWSAPTGLAAGSQSGKHLHLPLPPLCLNAAPGGGLGQGAPREPASGTAPDGGEETRSERELVPKRSPQPRASGSGAAAPRPTPAAGTGLRARRTHPAQPPPSTARACAPWPRCRCTGGSRTASSQSSRTGPADTAGRVPRSSGTPSPEVLKSVPKAAWCYSFREPEITEMRSLLPRLEFGGIITVHCSLELLGSSTPLTTASQVDSAVAEAFLPGDGGSSPRSPVLESPAEEQLEENLASPGREVALCAQQDLTVDYGAWCRVLQGTMGGRGRGSPPGPGSGSPWPDRLT